MTDRTGPKISTWAMTEELATLPKTVGSTNQPRSRSFGRPPPVARVAPSATPLAMYPSTRSRWRLAASGPICVCASNGSPTRIWAKVPARASRSSSWRLRLTTILVRRSTPVPTGGDGVQDARLTGPDLAEVAVALAQPGRDRGEVLGPLGVGQARPGTLVEGLPRGAHGPRDVR